jgi:hypothetical protein
MASTVLADANRGSVRRPIFWQPRYRVRGLMVLCENHASRAAVQRIRRLGLQTTAKPLHGIRNYDSAILPHVITRKVAMASHAGQWHQVKQSMPGA